MVEKFCNKCGCVSIGTASSKPETPKLRNLIDGKRCAQASHSTDWLFAWLRSVTLPEKVQSSFPVSKHVFDGDQGRM